MRFTFPEWDNQCIQYNKGPEESGPKEGIEGVYGRVFSEGELYSKPNLTGAEGGFEAAVDIQFAVNIFEMLVDRLRGNHQGLGNFLIRAALCQKLQALPSHAQKAVQPIVRQDAP